MIFKITKKKGLGRNFHNKELYMKPAQNKIILSIFDKSINRTTDISMELDLLDIIRLKAFFSMLF